KLTAFLLIFGLLLVGCGKGKAGRQEIRDDRPMEKQLFILDTVVTIKLFDNKSDEVMNGVVDVIKTYNDRLSAYEKGSDINRINSNGTAWTEVDPSTVEVIRKGLDYSEKSGGRFDITIGAVSMLWDFTDVNSAVPSLDSIREGLRHVDYRQVAVDGNRVQLKQEGMKLDLGGIAKGYIADKAKEYLLEKGVRSAIINLGGNVLCVGDKNGQAFQVGIQDPAKIRNEIIGTAAVHDASMVTSGIYERYVKNNGHRYHHILDATTGFPCEDGIAQVTIFSKKSVDGDALSTTCFLLGVAEGMTLIESMADTEALFVTNKGERIFSSGFEAGVAWVGK
ncbi:MAG: FAD:protein FMN transferase, partial [Eubacteriales bacterium]|nr:FAD:protein FMN transferase [Eubacteriales bacterium]